MCDPSSDSINLLDSLGRRFVRIPNFSSQTPTLWNFYNPEHLESVEILNDTKKRSDYCARIVPYILSRRQPIKTPVILGRHRPKSKQHSRPLSAVSFKLTLLQEDLSLPLSSSSSVSSQTPFRSVFESLSYRHPPLLPALGRLLRANHTTL